MQEFIVIIMCIALCVIISFIKSSLKNAVKKISSEQRKSVRRKYFFDYRLVNTNR